jgi:hypothetical protein
MGGVMGLISELRDVVKRKRGKAPPIGDQMAAVNAAMARLRQEREATEAGISAAAERRREILLEDASDDAIAELDRGADRLHLQLERIDAIEPELLARLQDLQNAARRQEWQSLVHQHDQATRDYLAAFDLFLDRYRQVLGIWERAAAKGFDERLHRFVTPTHIVDADILYRLERDFARVAGIAPTTVAPVAQPVAVAPKPAVGGGQVGEITADATGKITKAKANGHDLPPAAAVAKRRASRRPLTEPQVGEAAVDILRSGVEMPDGSQASTGDRFNLPSAQARTLVEHGAADYVQKETEA